MSGAFDSTDDRRTENSVVRHQYRELSPEEKATMGWLKDTGEAFIKECDSLTGVRPDGARALAIAKTKMEEAVMWAVKGLTS